MELDALEHIIRKGLGTDDAIVLRSLDMRYYGQGHELEVKVGKPFKADAAKNSFEKLHEAVYGFKHEGEDIEATAARLNVIVPRVKAGLAKPRNQKTKKKPVERRVYFEGEWLDTTVHVREHLPVGFSLDGPAIVEEYDSTTVVPPGWRLKVDPTGCMVMET